MTWQIQPHRGAPSNLTLDPDVPARLPGEAVKLTQPQPRSLTNGFRREERFEDTREDIRRHAGARIGHRKHDVIARLQSGFRSDVSRVQVGVGRFDYEPSSLGHGVTGVDR